MIKITNDNFDLETEFKSVSSDTNGAYSFFLGTVRSDLSSSNTVSYTHLTLPTTSMV